MVPSLVQVALDGLAYIYLSPLNLFSMLSLHYEKLYMIRTLVNHLYMIRTSVKSGYENLILLFLNQNIY